MLRTFLHLSGRDLAQEAARQELIAVRRGLGSSLSTAVRLARAVELPIVEIQRATGAARQTIYNVLGRERTRQDHRNPVAVRQAIAILVLADSGGQRDAADIAVLLGLSIREVQASGQSLIQAGLVTVARPSKPKPPQATTVVDARYTALPDLADAVRFRMEDIYLRRLPGYFLYLAIDPEEEREIAQGARELLSRDSHLVIAASVAPSKMDSPELALRIESLSGRAAATVARDAWVEIRRLGGLPEKPLTITSFGSPPGVAESQSPVIDGFMLGLDEYLGPADAELAWRERDLHIEPTDDRQAASWCLELAANAFRRAVGNTGDVRSLDTGDAAWEEWMVVKGQHVDARLELIQRPLELALELAVDRLGPIPAGRLGAIRHPEQSPRIVEGVEPSAGDLAEMARLAGEAAGAGVHHQSTTVARDLVRELLSREASLA